jgi:hypothetical protein
MQTRVGLYDARTISSVQTLLIHTFSLPSMPLTFSSSTPSHQHRRAGFLQNRSSFCAIPTALLFAKSFPLISVRSLARAILQMTALFGSPARCPHLSSWLKPLNAGEKQKLDVYQEKKLTLQSTSQLDVARSSPALRFFAGPRRCRLA